MTPENTTPINKFADVPLRVKTWGYIILVFAAGISHPVAMKVFVSFLCYQSFRELFKIFKVEIQSQTYLLLFGAVLFLLLYFLDFQEYFYYAAVLLFPFTLFLLLVKSQWKTFKVIGLGLLICFISLPFLSFIRDGDLGLKSIIFLVVVTELNDIFQYLMGKFFGKHKIVPRISPNKTVEGFLGGLLLTTILSNILGNFLLENSILINSLLGLMLGSLGFLGDVSISCIKRKANVKDTGNLLPGHGGLLDRIDSLIYNAPAFYLFIYLLNK